MKSIIILLILIAPITVYAGKYYKCKDATGAMTFQSKPCPSTSQQTKKTYTQRNVSKSSQCKISCDADYQVCLAQQDGGIYNSDGGIKLCQNEKRVCHVGCTDPSRARELEYAAVSMRANYNKRKAQAGANSRTFNTGKSSSNTRSNQNCTTITRDTARQQAIEKELSRHSRYGRLTKTQKERVDRRTNRIMSNACPYDEPPKRMVSIPPPPHPSAPVRIANPTPAIRQPIPSTGGGFFNPVAGGYMAPNGGGFCQSVAGGLDCEGKFVPLN